MTAKDAVRWAGEELSRAGIPDSRFEAEQLVMHICGYTLSQITLKSEEMSQRKTDALESLVKKRILGEPLQYIIGEWEFYSLPFKVGPGVLIPRADTELLVDLGLEFIGGREGLSVIDLCAGSGAISVSLDKNTSGCSVYALEKYDEAFGYLSENIKLNKSDVKAVKEDIENPISGEFDLILCNPPYIRGADMPALQKEVSFEPETALCGGEDGLYFYRVICEKWVPKLNLGGALMVEIGFDQREEVTELFLKAGLKNVVCKKDLNGLDRVIIGTVSALSY